MPFGIFTHAFLRISPSASYFFWPATCPCIGAATMVQKFDDDKHGMGHKAMLCGGIAPMSPCPCCAYCGVGPCAAEWRFIKDPADPTKWNATGSVFACQTCEMCTNHAGDTFVFDENHTGTKEKPLEVSQIMRRHARCRSCVCARECGSV